MTFLIFLTSDSYRSLISNESLSQNTASHHSPHNQHLHTTHQSLNIESCHQHLLSGHTTPNTCKYIPFADRLLNFYPEDDKKIAKVDNFASKINSAIDAIDGGGLDSEKQTTVNLDSNLAISGVNGDERNGSVNSSSAPCSTVSNGSSCSSSDCKNSSSDSFCCNTRKSFQDNKHIRHQKDTHRAMVDSSSDSEERISSCSTNKSYINRLDSFCCTPSSHNGSHCCSFSSLNSSSLSSTNTPPTNDHDKVLRCHHNCRTSLLSPSDVDNEEEEIIEHSLDTIDEEIPELIDRGEKLKDEEKKVDFKNQVKIMSLSNESAGTAGHETSTLCRQLEKIRLECKSPKLSYLTNHNITDSQQLDDEDILSKQMCQVDLNDNTSACKCTNKETGGKELVDNSVESSNVPEDCNDSKPYESSKDTSIFCETPHISYTSKETCTLNYNHSTPLTSLKPSLKMISQNKGEFVEPMTSKKPKKLFNVSS